MKWISFISFILLVPAFHLTAQDNAVVVHEIKLNGISKVLFDRFKNLYVTTEESALLQYDLKGIRTAEYNEIRYGRMTVIDINNPLSIMIYYGDFGVVQILDRNLTLQSEINLRQLGFFTNTAIGLGADNNLWFYNLEKLKLIKIDPQGKIIRSSNELTGLIGKTALTGQIWEQDNFLLIRAPQFGWMLFDDFGSYLQNLPLPDDEIQYFTNNRIIYRQDDFINALNLNNMKVKSYPIPAFIHLTNNIQYINESWIEYSTSAIKIYQLE